MQKRKLGRTDMMISPVIYGGIVSMEDGQENSDRYVAFAIEQGINYFDVAPSYGDAQEKLGNSLIPYRDRIYLACKTQERTAEAAKRELEASLKMLHTDHLDNYQMHALSSVEEVETAFSRGGAMEVFLKNRREGVLKHLGITCHSEEAALRALELYDFDTVLFPTNWSLNLAKGFGSRLAEQKKQKDFGFLGMKSMIHRAWHNEEERLSSRFPKSWCKPIEGQDDLCIAAIKYAFSMGIDAMVPPGNIESFTFAIRHIDEILAEPLSEQEKALLKSQLGLVETQLFF